MAEPPKLELLTRTAGAPGFHIHELHSGQSHRQFRPRRLPDDAWQVTPQPPSPDGTRTYILKNLRQDRFLLLSSREYFLWQLFDGTHSLEEIARTFHFEFGAFDYNLIRQLLAKLYQGGLLIAPDPLALQRRPNRAREMFGAAAGSNSAASGVGFRSRCRMPTGSVRRSTATAAF